MSHRTLLTSLGGLVNHSHYSWDYDPAQKASLQASYLSDPAYPGIQPVHYVHLNGVDEELLPTTRYNCWGFTFNPRQCWISSGGDVQTILNDNAVQVYPPQLRLGDVICYRDQGVITHTGRIVALDGAGQPSLVQSKWGKLGEYLHAPHVAPSIYGTDRTYWRATPLQGKGEAWVRDNASDDRLPCPPGVLCQSPDLWLNNSAGTYHEDALGGQPNNVYVRVHNPDTLPIVNAQARVYWADPTTGMPHHLWHPIGAAPVNVPASGQAVTSPVVWTPDSSVPNHPCLFAILDTGDDPCAAATLDPIVWPFDWAFDNNIVWHNLNVVWLKMGSLPRRLYFVVGNPLPWAQLIEVAGRLEAVGPEEVRAMNLDPRIAEQIKAPPRRRPGAAPMRLRAGVTIKAERRERPWKASGGFGSPRGWRLAAPEMAPGRTDRVSLMVSPNRTARPGRAYTLYFEQKVGGRPTGALTFLLVIH